MKTSSPAPIAPAYATGRTSLALIFLIVALAVVLLGCLAATAQSAASAKVSSQKTPPAAAQIVPASAPDLGERKFQANCGRCHNAPEQLSPRIAGTVIRHMRVRASLSAQDECDILRYLAP